MINMKQWAASSKGCIIHSGRKNSPVMVLLIKSKIEQYQRSNSVQLYKRNSRSIEAAKSLYRLVVRDLTASHCLWQNPSRQVLSKYDICACLPIWLVFDYNWNADNGENCSKIKWQSFDYFILIELPMWIRSSKNSNSLLSYVGWKSNG